MAEIQPFHTTSKKPSSEPASIENPQGDAFARRNARRDVFIAGVESNPHATRLDRAVAAMYRFDGRYEKHFVILGLVLFVVCLAVGIWEIASGTLQRAFP